MAKNWKQSEFSAQPIYTMDCFVAIKKTVRTIAGNLEGFPWGAAEGEKQDADDAA